MSSLILAAEFSCAHVYRRPEWSEEKNFSTFGKCSYEDGHGHNYRLEVQCAQAEEAKTQKVLLELKERIDHHHLNLIIEDFKLGQKIPTTENFAIWIANQFQSKSCKILAVRLFETENIWAEILI